MHAPWLIFHIVSGQALLSGAAGMLAATALSPHARRMPVRVVRNVLVLLGITLAAVSSTPWPPGLWWLIVAVTLAWRGGEAWPQRVSARALAGLRLAVAAAWLVGAAVEVPYHLPPRVPPVQRPVLGIVGDSLTAGVGNETTPRWPEILAARRGLTVRDHAASGATAASALRQVEQMEAGENLVLLEIGGNNLLGGTPAAAFAADLERLLRAVARPGRTVVMMELPLPPFQAAYGRAQRRLASRYGVHLVPKRVLARVLLADGATLDTIHLSPQGHARLAAAVGEVIP